MNKIKINEDLDLHNTLFSGQAFRWYLKDNWYYGYINNSFIRIRIIDQYMEYESYLEQPYESEIIEYFDLNFTYKKIFSKIEDKYSLLAYKELNGLKILNQDPWECLISFIISAWSNVPKISKTINDLCVELGDKQIIGDEIGYTFPSPSIISKQSEKFLRKFGLGYRSKYVLNTSRLLSENLNIIYELFNKTYEEALSVLLKFPGVGDKVANCVLIYSLKKHFAFPVDLWIDRILVQDYGIDKKMPLIKKRKWAQNYFGDHAGIIQHFLFHYKRKYNQ